MRENDMRRRFPRWTALALGLAALGSGPWMALGEPRSVGVATGTNFFGGVVTATYEQPIGARLFVGAGLAWGSDQFHYRPGEALFGYRNKTPYDIKIYLEANYDLDLYAGVRLFRGGKWRFLPDVAVGWSWFDLSYENVFGIPGTAGGDYRGVREIEHSALFTRLDLLEYRPSPRGFFMDLGIQARTAFLPSPLKLVARNDIGDTYLLTAGNPAGGPLVIPYPDLFVRAGYRF